MGEITDNINLLQPISSVLLLPRDNDNNTDMDMDMDIDKNNEDNHRVLIGTVSGELYLLNIEYYVGGEGSSRIYKMAIKQLISPPEEVIYL